MMWKTIVARNVGFFDGFDGYSLGEDLEFSVRMQREGKLVMACRAQLKHLHEDAGRPDARQHGYMVIHNALHIHRQAFPDRTWNDVLWFAYGWTLETIFYLRSLLFPRRIKQTIQHVLGRAQAVFDIISRRPRSSRS
jgi:GT2 family glycosyltransferase